jgi:hypothetical protein
MNLYQRPILVGVRPRLVISRMGRPNVAAHHMHIAQSTCSVSQQDQLIIAIANHEPINVALISCNLQQRRCVPRT